MASALLWLAGPVVSIPAYALFGMQPGPADFAIPSGVAVIGTVYLLFSKRSARCTVCRQERSDGSAPNARAG